VASNEFSSGRRPLVIVEDHLHHVAELLSDLANEAPELLAQTSVFCLERPGPDTTRAVGDWLERYPQLAVHAAVERTAAPVAARALLHPLDDGAFHEARTLALAIAAELRPHGLLVQDIQLASVAFVPADRWWESIFLAAAVRGLYPTGAPTVRFLSNKRGYAATFGKELLDHGFDPRDVMDKGEARHVVVPVLRRHVDASFDLELSLSHRPADAPPLWIGSGSVERPSLEAELDLLLWPRADGGVELSGRSVGGGGAERRDRLALRAGSAEGKTWRHLIDDRLGEHVGIPVVEIGERLAPPEAGRAEATNVAARHLHTLRGRLAVEGAIVTAAHAYRLNESLRVGVAVRR
jgi:hypothetical protein